MGSVHRRNDVKIYETKGKTQEKTKKIKSEDERKQKMLGIWEENGE